MRRAAKSSKSLSTISDQALTNISLPIVRNRNASKPARGTVVVVVTTLPMQIVLFLTTA